MPALVDLDQGATPPGVRCPGSTGTGVHFQPESVSGFIGLHTKSHSRPHVSNDNPYSEAQFKTLKYRPDFPRCFASIQAARAFCRDFFAWYDLEHHHAGLGLLTPSDVHHGRAAQIRQARAGVLLDAYAAHPERFVSKVPAPPDLPTASWINEPDQANADAAPAGSDARSAAKLPAARPTAGEVLR